MKEIQEKELVEKEAFPKREEQPSKKTFELIGSLLKKENRESISDLLELLKSEEAKALIDTGVLSKLFGNKKIMGILSGEKGLFNPNNKDQLEIFLSLVESKLDKTNNSIGIPPLSNINH